MIGAIAWLWGLYKALQSFAPAEGEPCPWCGRTYDVAVLEKRLEALEEVIRERHDRTA